MAAVSAPGALPVAPDVVDSSTGLPGEASSTGMPAPIVPAAPLAGSAESATIAQLGAVALSAA
ncbi:hypothetical protein [Paraburkholderia sacchari]|uniref:Uncharacterized protein n=1 Tax=Paraburkholderia sacchari TaxID=159450 RepID=A0A8T6ZBZ9_9BURK|nr:hypothetical protein [Paraburkholderia sacchari]NLP62202.1 hypothetical protein [Paraburkholderia sacchari]